ncbi:hypothetical protein Cni_G03024 [Canna indica]|uniref:Late embryogenesis abundant protein LEA-2 subgroup domain-containing protein n=1 Tax=Canna indica TaxID=4628 RepID=A0AAQ3JSG2_9LILI|nr:hypothetical protein Cni_G03024 [Canna indica]
MKFENFIIQASTDASLVPTDMATLNSTVKLTFRNTDTFFDVHVSATPFQLDYKLLNLATGDDHTLEEDRLRTIDPSCARFLAGVVGDVLSARVGWAVAEVGVVGAEELGDN